MPRLSVLELALFLLVNLAFSLDFIDLLVRLYLRRQHTLSAGGASPPTSVVLHVGTFTQYQAKMHVRPFAIVASVYNAASDIGRFLTAMEPLKDRVWLIDDCSTDNTVEIVEAAGFRCMRATTNRGKPGALKILVASLPPEIKSIVVMDPDVRILTSTNELLQIIFELQRSGMAALTPLVVAAGSNWLARIQRFEYRMACSLGRKSLADYTVTSGVAIYRADALRRVLAEHSLSVYAEDFENTMILMAAGEYIYYDGRFVIETDAMPTVSRLFSQRVGWYFGLMRVYLLRWRTVWARSMRHTHFAYQYIAYTGVFVLLLHPLKVVGLAVLAVSAANLIDNAAHLGLIPDGAFTNPLYFASAYGQCLLVIILACLTGVARGERRSVLRIMPLYPLYAMGHLVPATVGYMNWITCRLWSRRLYRDHYRLGEP
jgi:cellulose synthase/poly-beta-1,6-N-acetylglucosamine synthase-like glycosyltransferase